MSSRSIFLVSSHWSTLPVMQKSQLGIFLITINQRVGEVFIRAAFFKYFFEWSTTLKISFFTHQYFSKLIFLRDNLASEEFMTKFQTTSPLHNFLHNLQMRDQFRKLTDDAMKNFLNVSSYTKGDNYRPVQPLNGRKVYTNFDETAMPPCNAATGMLLKVFRIPRAQGLGPLTMCRGRICQHEYCQFCHKSVKSRILGLEDLSFDF